MSSQLSSKQVGSGVASVTSSEAAELPTSTLRPRSGFVSVDLGELWERRDLLYFLALREIKLRYKQTILGVTWAILQPFMTMVVFSVFFGRFAKLPSDGVPYPVFAFTALVPWQLFANAMSQAANSLVANQQLIKKVYFPRLIIPLSSVLEGLIDFLIAFVILLAMLLFYGIVPTVHVIFLPLFVLLALVTAAAMGIWLSALNVEYRDVRYTLPFLTQIWMFSSPIAYSATLVPQRWRVLYGLNPMTGVISGFRWALLGRGTIDLRTIGASTLVVLALLFSSLVYFRRMERNVADVI
jgi:lipopolysaccharide transport system permease protein